MEFIGQKILLLPELNKLINENDRMKLAELLVENAVDDAVLAAKILHNPKTSPGLPPDDTKKEGLKTVLLYVLGVTKEPVYAVYFNKPNDRVRIHKIGCCGYPKPDGRRDSSVDDGWGFFMEGYAAKAFAIAVSKSKNLHGLNDCHVCKRNGWSGLL